MLVKAASETRAFAPAPEPTQQPELLAQLVSGIRSALQPLTPTRPFALVDFPAHPNVGDSAIWLGETKFMRDVFGASPAYVSKWDDFDLAACRAVIGDGTIFLHGGGNFGDLWPEHHTFRLRLLRECRENPLVQLPQSIHFRESSGVDATARAIAEHGRFTLLVRDRTSLAQALAMDCRAILCCDLACFLGAQPVPRAPNIDVLCLMRTDGEKAVAERAPQIAGKRRVTDWLDESRPYVRSRRALAILGAAAAGRPNRHRLRAASFEAAARARFQRGLRLLASGRSIVTDRLHAHILALLLDRPHVVLDNNYGKLSGFLECWTGRYARVRLEKSLDAALRWAELQAATAQESEVS